jgi:hypothetical protein
MHSQETKRITAGRSPTGRMQTGEEQIIGYRTSLEPIEEGCHCELGERKVHGVRLYKMMASAT